MATAIQSYIIEQAEKRGVDPRLALAIAKQESNFNPLAKSKDSSAFGLYQFTDKTWQGYGIDPKSAARLDPKTQIDLGLQLIKDNQDYLSVRLGRPPKPHEVYMAHVLGAGRAKAVLSKSGNLADVLPADYLTANTWLAEQGTTDGAANWFDRTVAKRVSEVQPIVAGGRAFADPKAMLDEVKLSVEGRDWPLRNATHTNISGAPEIGGRLGAGLDNTQAAVQHPLRVSVLDPQRAVSIDLAGMSPEVRQNLLQNAQKEGFNAAQFDRNAPDSISLEMRPGEPTTYRFLDQAGKNFLRGRGARNFPADHWAQGVVSGKRADDPKMAGAATPAEAIGRSPLPAQQIEPAGKSTITPLDSTPQAPFTLDELDQIEHQQAADAPGFWKTLGNSASADWSINWARQNAMPFTVDPEWHLTPEYIKERLADLPQEYWDGIEHSVSREHADHLVEMAHSSHQLEQELARAGYTGAALRFMVNIFDPTAIAMTYASDGTLAPLIAAKKWSRAGKLLASASSAALSNAGVEAMLYSQKPGANPSSILYSAATAFTLSSAFHVRRGDVASDVKTKEVPNALKRYVDSFVDDGIGGLPHQPPVGGSLSAARAGAHTPLNHLADQALQDAAHGANATARAAAPLGPRLDAVGQTLNSEHPLAAQTMDGLGEDAIGRVGNATNTLSASEFQRWYAGNQEVNFHRAVEAHWRDYLGERGITWRNPAARIRARRDFMEEITRSMRGEFPERVSDPARRAGEALRGHYDEMLADAGRFRASGFDGNFVDDFVKRVWHGGKMARLRARFGDAEIERFLAGAYHAANPHVDGDDAQAFGRIFWQRLRMRQLQDSYGMIRGLHERDTERLREQMLYHIEGMGYDEATVDRILDGIRVNDAPAHGNAAHRELIDELHGANVRTVDGDYAELRLSDFLENNAENLFKSYARNMSGIVAMARHGYPDVAAFERRLRHIRESAGDIENYSEAALSRDIENLEYMGTMITGSPVGEFGRRLFHERSTPLAEWMRLGRDLNFLRLMGQLGFAQLAELGSVLGHVGFRTALAGIPTLRSFVRDARSGNLDDSLARELEVAMGGLGADRFRNPGEFRHEDFGTYINPDEGTLVGHARHLMDRGKVGIAELSGANFVNTILHRWSMRAVAQKYADLAFGSGRWNEARLRAYGLGEDEAQTIFRNIREHAEHRPSLFSERKLTQLNLDRWPAEDREIFQQVLFRTSRHIVQENDPGNVHRFMSRPFYQMMTQFRTFTLVAFYKQLGHGLHMRDINTALTFLSASFTAGLAYVLQTTYQALGRDDSKQFLTERLTPAMIGAASFARAGWSSILPNVMDTGIIWAGFDPVFDVRSTGLSSGSFTQNPTFDAIASMSRATSGAFQATTRRDYDFSQKDFKAWQRLLPLGNAIGIGTALNIIGQGLPDASE